MCRLLGIYGQVDFRQEIVLVFHDSWAFIHNGTVYEAESLPRDASLIPTSDKSDTECFLLFYNVMLSKQNIY
jgi:predicted glutamine amidotransferase